MGGQSPKTESINHDVWRQRENRSGEMEPTSSGCKPYSRIKVPVHEPFPPYRRGRRRTSWSRTLRLKRTGCHTIQPKLVGLSKGKVDVFNFSTRELPFLVTSGLSFTSGQTAGTHWLSDAVHPFEMYDSVLIGNRQVKTDYMIWDTVGTTVRLRWSTHDQFEIRFGQSWTIIMAETTRVSISDLTPYRWAKWHTLQLGARSSSLTSFTLTSLLWPGGKAISWSNLFSEDSRSGKRFT